MNKCPKCGNKLSPVDVLCPRCGALVEVIHVASHPNAVPSENTGMTTRHDPEPADPYEQSDLPITRLPREAVNQPEQDDIPESIEQTQEVSDTIEEDNLPMSRQARKAAMRGRRTKTAASAAANESTNTEDNKPKKWLELEEVDSAENEIKREDNADYGVVFEENSLIETSDDNDISDSQVSEVSPEDNALIDDSPRRYRMRSDDESDREPRKEAPRKRSPIALIMLMWVVIAAAVFGAFYFLDTHVASTYGGWNDFVRQITNGKIELDTSASYQNSITVDISETQTQDGSPAHRFDITMAGGKSIMVLPLGDSFNMDNNSVSFTIADEDLARSLGTVTSDPTVAANDLKLEITTISETFTHMIDSLTLTLTEAVYTLEAPSLTDPTSTDESMQIAMTVSPDATVFINNTDHTAMIDEYGHLSVSMPLDMDENLFVIEVIQPGRQTVKESFTVTREEVKASLIPSNEFMRVSESPFECTGTTDSGATLTATLNGKLLKALVTEDGKYSIACTLEKYGVYNLQVKAVNEGRSDAEATVKVEYVPEQQSFMDDARTFTVSKFIKNMDSLDDTAIKIEAKADSITAEEYRQTFVLAAGEDTLNCYYYGSTELSADKSYTFYGIADALNESFYVMFVE